MTAENIARRWYVVVGLTWIARYLTLGTIPIGRAPVWADWFDQSRYLASALALAHGDLAAGAHWYPLGYALAAAPFAWIVPRDPFLPLDLILFVATCAAFRRVAARLGIGGGVATACFLATTLVQTPLASAWAQPWTTTLSAALIWWAIATTLALAEDARAGRLAMLGALAAALPLVRPVDALLSATIAAVVAGVLARRRAWAGLAVAAAAGVAVLAVYAALHLAIYGARATPYMIAAADTGFVWRDLGWKAYVLLLAPQPWFPDARGMLAVLPWIVPGAAGLIATLPSGEPRARRTIALLLLLIVPGATLMLTYADLQPPGLWYDGNIHYFKWAMPAFGAGVVLCWRLVRDLGERRALAAVATCLMLPLGIRIVPVAVDDATPARMLVFRGDTMRNWHEAYFAPAVIVDGSGAMRNVGDFHQVPGPTGPRAIAVRRLFARDPRRSDPGEPVLRADQPPFARFGERVTFLGL